MDNGSGYGYVGNYAEHIYTEEGDSWLTDTEEGFRFFYDGVTGYLLGYSGTDTTLTLPDSFTTHDGIVVTEYEIYQYAFYNDDSLTSVVIPKSVTNVGASSFSGCSSLTIFCVATSSSGWPNNWSSGCPVVWVDEEDEIPSL